MRDGEREGQSPSQEKCMGHPIVATVIGDFGNQSVCTNVSGLLMGYFTPWPEWDPRLVGSISKAGS